MNKLQITPEAARDMAEIKSYVADSLKNPISAVQVVKGITKSLRILLRYAEAGPSLEGKTGQKTDLRYLVCGNYLAFYRVQEDTVSVARILDGRQDYLRILFKGGANC